MTPDFNIWLDRSSSQHDYEIITLVTWQTICLPADYVKFELPPETPTYVSIGVDIKDIPKVSDKDFSVTLNAYFIVKWRDPRIIVSDARNLSVSAGQQDKSQTANRNNNDLDVPVLTALNLAILKDLWMPDVEIRNLQSFETHTILSKLEGLWVDEDHNLMHALASRITFICPMRFNSFPMDVQVNFIQYARR